MADNGWCPKCGTSFSLLRPCLCNWRENAETLLDRNLQAQIDLFRKGQAKLVAFTYQSYRRKAELLTFATNKARPNGGHLTVSGSPLDAERLPGDVLLSIFAFCEPLDVISLSQVCKKFGQVAAKDQLWRGFVLGASRSRIWNRKRNKSVDCSPGKFYTWKQLWLLGKQWEVLSKHSNCFFVTTIVGSKVPVLICSVGYHSSGHIAASEALLEQIFPELVGIGKNSGRLWVTNLEWMPFYQFWKNKLPEIEDFASMGPSRILYNYPIIPEKKPVKYQELPTAEVVAFDDLDGSFICALWVKEGGFVDFELQNRRRIAKRSELFGQAAEMISSTYGPALQGVFASQSWESVECIFQFYGQNSRGDVHFPEEQHSVILVDIIVDGEIVAPTRFLELFQGVIPIPKVLFKGVLTLRFVGQVRDGELQQMTKRGIICKTTSRPTEFLRVHNLYWEREKDQLDHKKRIWEITGELDYFLTP